MSDSFRSFERISAGISQKRADDESEVQRAALERLYAKQLADKEAVLVQGASGGWQVVLLRKLGADQRDLLLGKVYQSAEDEGFGFFSRMHERMVKAGIHNSSVEVRFKGLTVQGTQVVKPADEEGGLLAKLKGLGPGADKSNVRKWNIIDSVSGVLKPGRLTLLLGTPGSGRSVLMKALAGRLSQEKTLKVTAEELTYNGQGLDQFVPERTASYISQLDNHYGELTVRETLEFASRVQGGMDYLLEELEIKEKELGIPPDPDIQSFTTAILKSGKKSLRTDIILRMLGLDICADTQVGNHMLRGISGGQKKRVTAGEMMVGPAKVLFADEISTGLDSATTHNIVSHLRTAAQYRQSTQVVALLQPAPETFELFDDVMLLSSGKIIFHGPRELVLPFFEGLGFACPPRKGIADFMQNVPTLADQEFYWAGNPKDYKYVSAKEMADAFYTTTEAGKAMMKELESPYVDNSGGANDVALVKTTYGASNGELARACLRRGLLLMQTLKQVHMGRLVQTTIMGVIVGTLFLQEDTGLTNGDVEASLASANNMLGVLFFTCITFMVGAFADSAMFVQSLPVWYKQKTAKFYPAFCFTLQAVVMRLPWCFLESWVWTLLVYFLVGFVTSTRLLAFWAICFGCGVFSLTLFLACAALMRKVSAASALQATFMLLFFCTSGFILNKKNIPGGWNGVYWSNPMQYFLSGLVINEMTSSQWSDPVPGTGMTIGQLELSSRGFRESYTYVWVAIGVCGVLCSLMNFSVITFLLSYLNAPKEPVVVSEETYASNRHARSGITQSSLAAANSGPNGDANSSPKLDLEAQGDAAIKAGSSSLPFKPMSMTFKDMRYSVPFPRDAPRTEDKNEGPHAGQLLLLKGITGSFRPGVLTALMGASGAGKTTLMDVLAGRKTGGVITGDIRVNGFPKEHRTFARIMGYCEQTDIHVPYTSIEEALQFSAALRLPSNVSKETANAFVHEVMDLVELSAIKDSLVGEPGEGLSVEQRKRLTIAVELVANPSIVFMDEPTSGLDARAASLVMKAVKNTVATGRAVVCTIHQPSIEIFEAFHELLLLKRGGETIFHGPIGENASNLISYFSAIRGTPAIEPRVNPANWMLEVSSIDMEKANGHDFAELYRTSELASQVDATVDKFGQPAEGDAPLKYEDMHVASAWRQGQQLLARNSKELLRNFSYTGIRSIITIVCAIVFATLFMDQGQKADTFSGVLNIAGAMYAASIFVGVVFCFQIQDPIGLRRTVFYREYAAGTYGVLPYWMAEYMAELPWVTVKAMVYAVIVYFSIGFENSASKFLFFFLIIFLTLNIFVSFGMMCVHVTPNLEMSNALSGTSFALFNLLCGFMKPQPAIAAGWIWAYWLNPISYSLYGLVASQLGDVEQTTVTPGNGTSTVAQFVEDYFGFKHSFMGWTAVILVAFVLFFRVLALLALKKLNFQNR